MRHNGYMKSASESISTDPPLDTETGTLPGCQFASDNASGVCPEAWQAMEDANAGFAPGYGDDRWTQRASDLLRELFETDCDVFFTFNGTAANSLALSAMCRSYNSVICSEVAHVETDECGGPEFFSNGIKLLLAPAEQGKIRSSAVRDIVRRRSDIHYPKPKVLSLTQATELGTVYTVEELTKLCHKAGELELRVHLDGARLANAVAHLDVALKDLTWKAGVDVVCFGGTKNGLPVGDVVIFFDHAMAEEFDYRCKQAGQLASKMRYLSAPWVGVLEDGAWLRHARHANDCAAKLESQIAVIPGIDILCTRQANSVFLKMPEAWIGKLRERGWTFYTFIGSGARFMCSWSTSDADLAALVADLQTLAGS